jgi:predicted dehydrogenase
LRQLCVDLRNNKYGKVNSINARYTKGVLVNGSHLIDILYWFFGMPIDIATYHIHNPKAEDPGVDFRIKFKPDIDATFLHIPDVPYVYINIDLFTEKGKLSISQRGQKIEWHQAVVDTDYNTLNKLELMSNKETEWRDCPTRALVELMDAMEHGGDISCTPEDGIRVSEICENIINN